jgi:hypothetical protein
MATEILKSTITKLMYLIIGSGYLTHYSFDV